jgi:5-methylcytosine-specific restriction endonuclease McrA
MGLYKRDGGICHICQKPVKLKDFSVDHLIPRIHGGPGTWENLATAHFRCNAKRGAGKIEAQLRLF